LSFNKNSLLVGGVLCGVDFVDLCPLQSTRMKRHLSLISGKWLLTEVNRQNPQR
jgi:hypothetical protein